MRWFLVFTASKTDSGFKALAPPKAKTPLEKVRVDDDPDSAKGNNGFLEGEFLLKDEDELPLLKV